MVEFVERSVAYSFKLLPQQLESMRLIAKERQLAIADIAREAIREYLAADAVRRGPQEHLAA